MINEKVELSPEKQERAFQGIWIPKDIWFTDDLTLQEKVFYVEICSLDNENGCFALNEYFANFFGISKTRVSKVINSLVEKEYITSEIHYKKGTKQIIKRVLKKSSIGYTTKVQDPIEEKFKTPIEQKFIGNNKITNNTINKKKMSEIKISDVPLEFQEYFEVAEAFRNLFIKNLKEAGAGTKHQDNAKFKDYADQIRLMFKNDDATKEQFQKVFMFLDSPKGEFWKPNILSIKKLREKFDKLVMDANKNKPKSDKRAAVVYDNSNWNV